MNLEYIAAIQRKGEYLVVNRQTVAVSDAECIFDNIFHFLYEGGRVFSRLLQLVEKVVDEIKCLAHTTVNNRDVLVIEWRLSQAGLDEFNRHTNRFNNIFKAQFTEINDIIKIWKNDHDGFQCKELVNLGLCYLS